MRTRTLTLLLPALLLFAPVARADDDSPEPSAAEVAAANLRDQLRPLHGQRIVFTADHEGPDVRIEGDLIALHGTHFQLGNGTIQSRRGAPRSTTGLTVPYGRVRDQPRRAR